VRNGEDNVREVWSSAARVNFQIVRTPPPRSLPAPRPKRASPADTHGLALREPPPACWARNASMGHDALIDAPPAPPPRNGKISWLAVMPRDAPWPVLFALLFDPWLGDCRAVRERISNGRGRSAKRRYRGPFKKRPRQYEGP